MAEPVPEPNIVAIVDELVASPVIRDAALSTDMPPDQFALGMYFKWVAVLVNRPKLALEVLGGATRYKDSEAWVMFIPSDHD
jgi:hypothetical protein